MTSSTQNPLQIAARQMFKVIHGLATIRLRRRAFPGVPYDELEKRYKLKVPVKVRGIRGKLNVPRERFHLRGKILYLWTGLQFK